MFQRILIVIIGCICLFGLKAQSYSLFRTFTTADGLPSNHIYKTVEDDYGFLWVATDAGVARFDGKQFQVFTTREGLPDNEVLDIVKEKSGKIWVNCFKQSPCYFDFVKNRFINATEDSLLAKVNGGLLIDLFALEDGGVMYVNEKGSFIFLNNKLTFYPTNAEASKGFLISSNNKNSNIYLGVKSVGQIMQHFLNRYENEKLDSSYIFSSGEDKSGRRYLEENRFYQTIGTKNLVYIISIVNNYTFRFQIDSIQLNELFNHITFSKNYINLITGSGELLMYDKKTLRLVDRIKGGFSPNALWEDRIGNYWVATIDKGLMLYKKRQIETLAMPDGFYNNHFLSIAKKPDGMILAGNFNSEIIEANGKKFFLHKVASGSATNWQRKIIISKDKIFSFSEGGSFADYINPLKQINGTAPYFTKTATIFNDSVIITATMGALDKLNTINEKVTRLHTPKKRATAITVLKNGTIYFGTIDGLYKYNYQQDSTYMINTNQPLLKERVISLTSTDDGLVWVATSSSGVVVVKNDQVVGQFTTSNGLISNDCRSIMAGKTGQVWLGTGSGISILAYSHENGQIFIKPQHISINDGLSSNIINDMIMDKDTVYAATGNGISIIPATFKMPAYTIPVYLTGVKVNQRDTAILSNYNLGYDQQNIQLQFAAIELGGHFKHLEYTINNNQQWLILNEPILNLQLNSGHYTIQVRAIDVNGNRSSKILLLEFHVASPFWKTFWFWFLIAFGLLGLIVYYVQQRAVKKRTALLEKLASEKLMQDLEMQSIKAQMNPHFVFNCLSSIKSLNYQQKNEEAGIFIDRFSMLMRNTLDYAAENTISLQSELNYIDNYLALEQLRFGSKLAWEIKLAPGIDAHSIQVPSLFLQPYVENAVKHGIHHLLDDQGMIKIDIRMVHGELVIMIDDNGVGRVAASTINEKNVQYHLSRGMQLMAKRERIYHIQTTINDKKDDSGKAIGTCVIIRIPVT